MARSSSRSSTDRMIRFLWLAIFGVTLVVLTGILYVVATGVLQPHAPRTIAEKQMETAEAALKVNSKDLQAWNDLIVAHTVAGDLSEAKKAFESAKESVDESVSPIVYVAYARAELSLGDPDKAMAITKDALTRAEAFRKARRAELKEQGISSTSPQYRNAGIGLFMDIRQAQAQIYRHKGEWERVVECMNETIGLMPTAADHLTLRGMAYAELGKTEKARADFQQAIKFGFDPAKDELKKLEKK